MNCIHCSAPLTQQSPQTLQNICVHCHILPAHDSPLQIGSTGEFNSENFSVIGCKKKVTNQISWLEWLILFEDSKLGWIREAQGTWSLFFFEAANESARSFEPSALRPQDIFTYAGKRLRVQKIYSAILEFENGESLLISNGRERSQILWAEEIDRTDAKTILYQFEYTEDPRFEFPPMISRGQILEFAKLHAKNLKALDGAGRIQKIICPNCSGNFLVRFKSFSFRAVCHSCYFIVDIASDDHMSLKQFDLQYKFTPLISLGTKGKILGELFEVIGCVRFLQAESPQTEMIRYLLFSPTNSYRWLDCEHGHWSINRSVSDLQPTNKDLPITYRGQKYNYSHQSEWRLVFATGEFFWPLQKDELFKMRHFIFRPFELSQEIFASETKIYLGRYLNPSQVSSAFKLTKTLPEPMGSIPHQVSPFHHLVKEILFIQILFLTVCFFVQLRSIQNSGSTIHQSQLHFSKDSDETSQSTEPFELRGATQALSFSIDSLKSLPLRFEAQLLDLQDKRKFKFPLMNNHESQFVSSVPSGLYLLNFKILNNLESKSESFDLKVAVVYGAKSWSNFFLAVLLISMPSFVLLAIDQNFEIRRKRNLKRLKGRN